MYQSFLSPVTSVELAGDESSECITPLYQLPIILQIHFCNMWLARFRRLSLLTPFTREVVPTRMRGQSV